MPSHIEIAIKKAVDGRYDVTEERIGNYEVFMKYDGYAVMLEIRYITEKDNVYIICKYDSLRQEVQIPDLDEFSNTKYRKKLITAINAIKNLNYEITKITAYVKETEGNPPYDEDITDKFLQYMNQ